METICGFSGFGGQGMLSVGKFVATLAMNKGLHTTWMPSYGAEMRGGTANCTVIYSDRIIGSPIVQGGYDIVVAMNIPSIAKFESKLKKDGILIINSDLVSLKEVSRKDIRIIEVPAISMANEIGLSKVQNMVILGVLAGITKEFDLKTVDPLLKKTFTGKKEKFIPMNIKAFEAGMSFIKENN